MRVALLVLVVAFGCSKKAEQKQEPTPVQPEVAKPAEDKSAESPKPAEDKPANKPPEPAATPKVDCATIVTPEDVQKACNAKVEIGPTMHEGKLGKLGVCNRSITEAGKKFPIAQWGVSWHDTATGAENWVKLEKSAEAKEVAGIGDFAWTRVHEVKDLKVVDYDVGVRKGAMVLKLGFSQSRMNKKPPCTLDQLVEVARIAVARLP
ncbi:MAG TPA: hypothetical protein VIV11_22480 [Kofleriaceae bacterium]